MTAGGSTSLLRSLSAERSWILAGLVVLVALAMRLNGVLFYGFNPDEAVHYVAVTQPTLAGAWAALLENPHPFGSLAFLWLLLQVSEEPAWLRLVGMIPGVSAVLLIWLAGRRAGGVLAATVAGLTVALSPAAIDLSQSMRGYMLQLAGICGALWCLLVWLEERRGMPAFAGFLMLGLLAEYSTAFFAGSCAVLLGGLWLQGRLEPRSKRSVALAAIAPGVTLALAYAIHLGPHVSGSPLQVEAWSGWLSPMLAEDLGSLFSLFFQLFGYLFGGWLCIPLLLLFVGALAIGLWQRRAVAFLTALVFGLAMGASLAGQHPFGPSRHSSYLVAFVALAIADALAVLYRAPQPVWRGALAAVALVVASGGVLGPLLGAARFEPLSPEQEFSREIWDTMEVTIDAIADREGLLLLDQHSYNLLAPKLQQHRHPEHARSDFGYHSRYEQLTVVSSLRWNLYLRPGLRSDPSHVLTLLENLHREHPDVDLRELESFWVFSQATFTRELAMLHDQAIRGGAGFLKDAIFIQPEGIAHIETRPFLAALRGLRRTESGAGPR